MPKSLMSPSLPIFIPVVQTFFMQIPSVCGRRTNQCGLNDGFHFQLERTLHRHSLAFIATRSSSDRNTSVWKLEPWQAKKNNSGLYFPGNWAEFLMLNQHGLAVDFTAHTTQIITGSSKVLCANSSPLWSNLNHRGVKKTASGYHKRL